MAGGYKPHSHDYKAFYATATRRDEAFIGIQQHRLIDAKGTGTGGGWQFTSCHHRLVPLKGEKTREAEPHQGSSAQTPPTSPD
ncbi:unnamed protein product [Taenia asiatica]|uniref:Transposase n=1 Tax=Taenia asiatica TaxID=60517 RepID=A0A0R3W040_TAEAS|nr:unnamed protein product [Taenia asiatica]